MVETKKEQNKRREHFFFLNHRAVLTLRPASRSYFFFIFDFFFFHALFQGNSLVFLQNQELCENEFFFFRPVESGRCASRKPP